MTEAHENEPSPDATGDEEPTLSAAPGLVVNVVTIFPDFFTTPLGLSIPSRAQGRRRRRVSRRRPARFHARPPSHRRRCAVRRRRRDGDEARPILRGRRRARRRLRRSSSCRRADAVHAGRRDPLFAGTELTILCGHYKDVDQRVADFLATEEISLGDFVLSGGEPAALGDRSTRRCDCCPARCPISTARDRDSFLRSRAERAELHAAAGVSRATRCPKCCSRAITKRSPSGGSGRASASLALRRSRQGILLREVSTRDS